MMVDEKKKDAPKPATKKPIEEWAQQLGTGTPALPLKAIMLRMGWAIGAEVTEADYQKGLAAVNERIG